MKKQLSKKLFHIFLAVGLSLSLTMPYPLGVFATNTPSVTLSREGVVVQSVNVQENQVLVNFADQSRMQIKFLRNDLFRIQKVALGGQFVEKIATPPGRENAHIIVQPDSAYEGSQLSLEDQDSQAIVSNASLKLIINKNTGALKVTQLDGQVIFEETQAIRISDQSSEQFLKAHPTEYFYGGGTQNGRFSHKGHRIEIVNQNNWVDGGVASPNPFYWSTQGYGMVRNTYAPGYYDFEKSHAETVVNKHNDARFDAYFFVGNSPADLLQDYVTLTGKPAQTPDYAFYLSHLNCYNRDYWVRTGNAGDRLIDGEYYREHNPNGNPPPAEGVRESLMPQNGNDRFTAKRQIDLHAEHDMPLGWFLPNDGYGCGYGQDATSLDNNIANLKTFVDYAATKGVKVGLWTQSNLTPQGNNIILQRDFDKEVNVAGVRALKTDVAWVGQGYTFGLNGLEQAAKVLDKAGEKHTVVTLDGWSGTQRYGGIWSGDQTGGQWEYIRFHIPTFIGTGLSGNPNVGSDMDGIFGGRNPIIQVRDFQYKAFAGYMLDMDGWGSSQKNPWEFGGKYADINRAYLKLKAHLMPYTATESERAHQTGYPILRAMFLEYPNAHTYSQATQYQYLWGSQFLVAPVYQATALQQDGSDIRNGIYLPNESNGQPVVWIDYITGKAYRGGSTLQGFEAPLWKLPVFVKNGAIIPMAPENNNPAPKTAANPKGLDRSQRIVEFYPAGRSEYTAYEDDGLTKAGPSFKTRYMAQVEGETLTLIADQAVPTGDVSQLVTDKSTEFIVNVSEAPQRVEGRVAGQSVQFQAVTSREDYEQAQGHVYFYDAHPQSFVKKYAQTEELRNLNLEVKPKLYIKSTEKVSVLEHNFEVSVEGYRNDLDLPSEAENSALAVPTQLAGVEAETDSKQITLSWQAVPDAESYDLMADGMIYSHILQPRFVHEGLAFSTTHEYKVRSVNATGHSAWSDVVSLETAPDPYRNVPEGLRIRSNTTDQGGTPIRNLYDHDLQSLWHTRWAAGDFNRLDIDLNGSYTMHSLDYLPRNDAGNGTFTSGKIQVSRDGVHYKEIDQFNWSRTADLKTYTFPSNLGRISHIRLADVRALGGFGAGLELTPYAKDPKVKFTTLDYNADHRVDENDKTFLQNYAGLSEAHQDNDFAYAEIADVNFNGVIDATDIFAVTRQLGQAVANVPLAEPQGELKTVTNKMQLQAGEEVTVQVYGLGLDHVHAVTLALPIDTSQFENIRIEPTYMTGHMVNFSNVRLHGDGSTVAYLLLANEGQANALSGSPLLANIKMRAKTNIDTVHLVATMGLLTHESLMDREALLADETLTEADPEETKLSPQVIANVRAKNEHLAEWTEPTALMQGGNYQKWYDGNPQSESEFKWYLGPDSFGPEVSLPIDLKFTLDETRILSKFVLRNRNNLNGNGTITSIRASYIGEDDVVHELQSFNSKEAEYTFTFPQATPVKAVIVTPLTSQGTASEMNPSTNRMLTFSELSLYAAPVQATGIAFSPSTPQTFREGVMTPVEAFVLPEGSAQRLYTIHSEQEDILSVERFVQNGTYHYLVHPKRQGSTKLIAYLNSNPDIRQELEVQVVDARDYTELNQWKTAIREGIASPNDLLFQEEGLKAMLQLLEEIEAKNHENQEQIQESIDRLAQAAQALIYKGSDESVASSDEKAAVLGATASTHTSAEQDVAGRAIDGDPETFWHSNYGTEHQLPQHITLELEEKTSISEVHYLPRQQNGNGDIIQYRILVSENGQDFRPVVAGYFEHSPQRIAQPNEEKVIKFKPVEAKYVRLVAERTLGQGGTQNDRYASVAELSVFRAKINTEEVPEATKSVGTGNLTLTAVGPFDDNALALTIAPVAEVTAQHLATLEENTKAEDVKVFEATVTGAEMKNIRFTLRLPREAGREVLKVVHIPAQGDAETFEANSQDKPLTVGTDYVELTTTSLSPFIVVYASNPDTGTDAPQPQPQPGTDAQPVAPGTGNGEVNPPAPKPGDKPATTEPWYKHINPSYVRDYFGALITNDAVKGEEKDRVPNTSAASASASVAIASMVLAVLFGKRK